MYLSSLSLQNFRSFKKASFEFLEKTTLVFGQNTAGKTNLLEAIYLLATGKSFRAETEKEMITYEKEISRIKVHICHSRESENPGLSRETWIPDQVGDDISTLEVVLTTGQVNNQPAPHKKLLLNGVSKRMLDFVGNLRCVLFWPEDLELVTDSPSIRRKYLDMVLCQVDREYRRSLLIYEQGVRQRNKLLERIREEGVNRAQLLYWDKLLIKHGGLLTEKRGEYIDFINLQSPMSNYQLTYDKSVISESRLEQYKNEEVAAGVTLVGPHRDNLKFEIFNLKLPTKRDLSLYGSRGEQRLAILWLKMAELDYVTEKTSEKPVLLLDDIFSELDHEHRDYVLQIIPQQQTIMTTTDLHLVDQKFLKSAKIIEL